MLHERKIYAAGTPDEIFNSKDPIVRRFIEGVADPKTTCFNYEQITLEWKVGLFVLIGLALLAD